MLDVEFKPITSMIMQPDQTATEFAQTQPLLAASLDAATDTLPRPRIGVLTRVTFCFAWLFGLEPFLSGSADEPTASRFDRR
jgi:hypothetical protein